MKVQLKGINSGKELKTIFNSISRILTYLNTGREEELYSKRVYKHITDIDKELLNNSKQYTIYYEDNYSIVAHIYDVEKDKDPSECEIIVREDNVIFESENATDIIFIPRQMLTSDNVEYVYTAVFVLLHLSLKLLANTKGNSIEEINFTSVSSLLATCLVNESIFYIENCPLMQYKDITKKSLDKILKDDIIISGGSYPHIASDSDLFNLSNILSEYLHNIHEINGERDYE